MYEQDKNRFKKHLVDQKQKTPASLHCPIERDCLTTKVLWTNRKQLLSRRFEQDQTITRKKTFVLIVVIKLYGKFYTNWF